MVQCLGDWNKDQIVKMHQIPVKNKYVSINQNLIFLIEWKFVSNFTTSTSIRVLTGTASKLSSDIFCENTRDAYMEYLYKLAPLEA